MIDTNVLVDIVAADDRWRDWSFGRLADAVDRGAAEISAIVVGELAVRGFPYELLVASLSDLGLSIRPFGGDAAYRAGRAQSAYRQAGGRRESLLGDFMIGAHAAVNAAALLTRDGRRYRTYFPEVTLITPESHP